MYNLEDDPLAFYAVQLDIDCVFDTAHTQEIDTGRDTLEVTEQDRKRFRLPAVDMPRKKGKSRAYLRRQRFLLLNAQKA